MSDSRAAAIRVPSIVRVLVVDDSAYVRKMMTQMLSRSPFVEVVATAHNGKDALELAAEEPQEIGQPIEVRQDGRLDRHARFREANDGTFCSPAGRPCDIVSRSHAMLSGNRPVCEHAVDCAASEIQNREEHRRRRGQEPAARPA